MRVGYTTPYRLGFFFFKSPIRDGKHEMQKTTAEAKGHALFPPLFLFSLFSRKRLPCNQRQLFLCYSSPLVQYKENACHRLVNVSAWVLFSHQESCMIVFWVFFSPLHSLGKRILFLFSFLFYFPCSFCDNFSSITEAVICLEVAPPHPPFGLLPRQQRAPETRDFISRPNPAPETRDFITSDNSILL